MNVVWKKRALDRLAGIYVGLGLDDQRALARAVEGMNRRLADAAWTLGESRTGDDRRIWFAGPLILTYRIESVRVVVVTVSPNPGGSWPPDPPERVG